jgi:hypothetical protein
MASVTWESTGLFVALCAGEATAIAKVAAATETHVRM